MRWISQARQATSELVVIGDPARALLLDRLSARSQADIRAAEARWTSKEGDDRLTSAGLICGHGRRQASMSGETLVVSPDTAASCHDHAGGQAKDPANYGRGKAKLHDGKGSSRCIDVEANDQPSDRPDHACGRSAHGCPPRGQPQA
jgi:hypothetical protein